MATEALCQRTCLIQRTPYLTNHSYVAHILRGHFGHLWKKITVLGKQVTHALPRPRKHPRTECWWNPSCLFFWTPSFATLIRKPHSLFVSSSFSRQAVAWHRRAIPAALLVAFKHLRWQQAIWSDWNVQEPKDQLLWLLLEVLMTPHLFPYGQTYPLANVLRSSRSTILRQKSKVLKYPSGLLFY